MMEAQNGLYPNHDRLFCFDKKCPLHQSNINVEIDENQSNLSNRSSVISDKTLNSTAIDTNSDSSSVSSSASMDEDNLSSPSSFSDTSSGESLYSTTNNSISESTSNQSMTTDRTVTSNKSFSRTEIPKIIISRASNDSVPSNDIHRRSSYKRKSKRQ